MSTQVYVNSSGEKFFASIGPNSYIPNGGTTDIPINATTNMPFPSAAPETDTSIVSSGSTLTFLQSGIYSVKYILRFQKEVAATAINLTFRILAIGGVVNNTALDRVTQYDAINSDTKYREISLSSVQYFAAGQSVVCQAINNTGGAACVADNAGCRLFVSKIY